MRKVGAGEINVAKNLPTGVVTGFSREEVLFGRNRAPIDWIK
jgi:hypothetical protein